MYAREIQDERSRTERSRTDEEIQEIQKRSRTDEVITALRTGVTSSVPHRPHSRSCDKYQIMTCHTTALFLLRNRSGFTPAGCLTEFACEVWTLSPVRAARAWKQVWSHRPARRRNIGNLPGINVSGELVQRWRSDSVSSSLCVLSSNFRIGDNPPGTRILTGNVPQ